MSDFKITYTSTQALLRENKQLKERIDKSIEYNEQIIKDAKDFYRPTSDVIYSGDTLIELAEKNIDILKGEQ